MKNFLWAVLAVAIGVAVTIAVVLFAPWADPAPANTDEPAGTSSSQAAAADGSTEWAFDDAGVSASDVTVVVPQDLRDLLGAHLIIDSVRVVGQPQDAGAQLCRADVTIHYVTDSARALLLEPSLTEVEASAQVDALVDGLLAGYGVADVDALIAHVDATGETAALANTIEADLEYFFLYDEVTQGDAEAAVHAAIDAAGDEWSARAGEDTWATILGGAFGYSEVAPLAQAATGDAGLYLSDDATTGELVASCAISPYDTDAAVELDIAQARLDDDPTAANLDPLADLDVTIMSDGTVTITGQFDGVARDASGAWIAR